MSTTTAPLANHLKRTKALAPKKPKGPPLVKVASPQRVRNKEGATGMVISSPAWGSPFRTKDIAGRWHVVWTGDDMGLKEYRPDGWQDIPCADRQEAAQLAQAAFEEWLLAFPRPSQPPGPR